MFSTYSVEIDECLNDPCNPIGTEKCIDFHNKFVCKCRNGYRGELCEGSFMKRCVIDIAKMQTTTNFNGFVKNVFNKLY